MLACFIKRVQRSDLMSRCRKSKHVLPSAWLVSRANKMRRRARTVVECHQRRRVCMDALKFKLWEFKQKFALSNLDHLSKRQSAHLFNSNATRLMDRRAQRSNYKGHRAERSRFNPENVLFHGQLRLRGAMDVRGRPSMRTLRIH